MSIQDLKQADYAIIVHVLYSSFSNFSNVLSFVFHSGLGNESTGEIMTADFVMTRTRLAFSTALNNLTCDSHIKLDYASSFRWKTEANGTTITHTEVRTGVGKKEPRNTRTDKQ